jgi:hypothetical protein
MSEELKAAGLYKKKGTVTRLINEQVIKNKKRFGFLRVVYGTVCKIGPKEQQRLHAQRTAPSVSFMSPFSFLKFRSRCKTNDVAVLIGRVI